ncbi:glycosyltransferase [Verrucomicrobiota bacterium]
MDAGQNDGLSVVVPAFNEAGGVKAVLDRLSETLGSGFSMDHEIIVVDDGSTDGTSKIAEEAGNVTVLRHEQNRGYGAALKTGITRARYCLVCITDADGTYPVERIPDLIARMAEKKCDMVVGARTGEAVDIPFVRRPVKWVIRKLACFVSGVSIPDLNSGLRVFATDTCRRFFSILPDGFSFTTTITLAMLQSGHLVEYVPIDYSKRVGVSKIRPVRDVLSFFQLVLSMALYFAPLKVFLPLSGILALVGVGWGLFSHWFLGQFADASTLIIVMTAVQVAMLGMLAELINRRVPHVYSRTPNIRLRSEATAGQAEPRTRRP